MKIICQNCFEILAERKDGAKWGESTFKYDPNKMDTILQEIDADNCLLTIA